MPSNHENGDHCGNCPVVDTTTPRMFRCKIEWIGGFAFFFGGSSFTAIGIWMIASGEPGGWLVAGFFGLIPCICLLRLLPNCAFIRVSQRGFEFRSSFRSVLFPWDDIESFDYCSLNDPPQEFVELVLAESAPDAGERIPVPPVYGIVPTILANLLNDWKRTITETGRHVEMLD
jgi:hypothetical protein